jgi:hypothetical protein
MVIKANGSERKTNSAVGIGAYLAQKVVRPLKIEISLRREKHAATFATLEDNLISNKILIDPRTMKSDASFRFTVAARAVFYPHQETSNNGTISQGQPVKEATEISS